MSISVAYPCAMWLPIAQILILQDLQKIAAAIRKTRDFGKLE